MKGIFSPFRAIGYVTGTIPCAVQARGQSYFIVSSIGHSFQIYNGEKMNLVLVGDRLTHPITAITSFKDLTFAACQDGIFVFDRSKVVFKLDLLEPVSQLLVLGDFLFALADDKVFIYDYKKQGLHI